MSQEYLLGDIQKLVAEGLASEKAQKISDGISSQVPVYPTFRKYLVLDVLLDQVEISTHIDAYVSKYLPLGVSNIKKITVAPRNTVIARPLEIDGGGTAMFLFPFFPSHLSLPCKPGELVWVIFERPDVKDNDIGYWICRVPDFAYVDDPNHTHFPRKWDPSMFPPGSRDASTGKGQPEFEFRNGAVGKNDDGERITVPETQVIAGDEDEFEKIIRDSDGAQTSVREAVPRFNKRPDDVVFEGSNNTLIVLGTDRSGPAEEFTDNQSGTRKSLLPAQDLNHHAGSIDLVAGRGQTEKTGVKKVTNSLGLEESDKSIPNVNPREGDPDLKNDRSRVIVTVGTGKSIDSQMNEKLVDLYVKLMSGAQIEQAAGAVPGTAAIKSDTIRIISRAEVMIVSTNYDVQDSKMIDKLDLDEFACVVLQPGGDIILRPAKKGFVKLGDEEADRAILCSAEPALSKEDGTVTHSPMISTMGGQIGTGVGLQGTYSTRVLVSAKK